MFFIKLALAVLPFMGLAPAAALPATPSAGAVVKSVTAHELDPNNPVADVAAASGNVRFCTNANFGGNCVTVTRFSSGQCVGVGSDFNDDVSSFAPASGNTCTIYANAGCSGRSLGGIIPPGINNLADYNINDMMSSFSCTF